MATLPKIPSPPAHRWREFRVKVMPVFVYVVIFGTVIVLWKNHHASPTVVGEVEVIRADIKAEQIGTLAGLTVKRFDRVSKGQILARLITTDTEALTNSLEAIRADLLLMRARMQQDHVRNELNFETLRLDILRENVLLATTRVKLREAESEYQRVAILRDEKLVSESLYDAAKNLRDALETEVTERARLVADLAKTLHDREPAHGNSDNPLTADKGTVDVAIAAQERKLRLSREPVNLRAPIDGVISYVHHQDGVRVLAGDPIVTITSTTPENIIGYLRQPHAFEPVPGMIVTIRTRGPVRQEVRSEIVSPSGEEYFTEMQRVRSPMRIRGYNNSLESGLPFLVAIPPGLKLHPGELVDLIIRTQ